MIMDVHLPLEPFNSAVRDGTIGETLHAIMEAMKPEAAYFSERHGQRGGLFIVDVESPSDIPRFAEPWFLAFEAEVEFRVCMSPEDLGRAGLDALGQEWG
jgi:hypothetical protein